MQTIAAPELDRLDRHVWRSYVRMGANTSRHRVEFALEEALRLLDLPGEREGRCYFFRTVSLGTIPAQSSRQAWMDQVRLSLTELAETAVHGSDPRANLSNAIFFDNREQALESLLRKALRAGSQPAWFAAAILGIEPESATAISIQTIVECLHQPDIPMPVTASIILSALGNSNPSSLLDALPSFAASEWLRKMSPSHGNYHFRPIPPNRQSPNSTINASAIPVTGQLRSLLVDAARHLGWRDSRVVWLAALGVIRVAPTALASGTAVERARATLQQLACEQPESSQDRPARGEFPELALSAGSSAPKVEAGGLRNLVFRNEAGDQEPSRWPESAPSPELPADARAGAESGHFGEQAEPEAIVAPLDTPQVATLQIQDSTPALLGEPTAAAGLYFFLQLLRRLGIAQAVEACPDLIDAGLVAHILKRLAAVAGVAPDDPILACLAPFGDEFSLPSETWPGLAQNPAIWPRDWRIPANPDSEKLLRVWTLAVRRWCWLFGRITIPEIVNRNGHVWLTRADLDVTLPLTSVDIRIRRVGLDLDPGWLPWFGLYGKVIRFHYRGREPGGRCE